MVSGVQRPPWAESVSFEHGRWHAVTSNGDELIWLPAGLRHALQDGGGHPGYALPHAAWWSAADFAAFVDPSGTIPLPRWAPRHGVDDHGYWAEFEVGAVVQRMRFISPGRFWMGSPLAEPERMDNEPLHAVTLTRGFWLADTACTQPLWQAVMGKLAPRQALRGDDIPVANVSHDDVMQQFLPRLERLVPGLAAGLPSEAEWEYAARAGTSTAFPWGDEPDPKRMNFRASSESSQPLSVRALPPNPWGLMQMHGNLWEWCDDDYAVYGADEALDPRTAAAAAEAAGRVLRGGSWVGGALYCRSARRLGGVPGGRSDFIGFRLARGLPAAGRAEHGGRGAPVLPAEPAGNFEPEARD